MSNIKKPAAADDNVQFGFFTTSMADSMELEKAGPKITMAHIKARPFMKMDDLTADEHDGFYEMNMKHDFKIFVTTDEDDDLTSEPAVSVESPDGNKLLHIFTVNQLDCFIRLFL
jgi:hypothetical protein